MNTRKQLTRLALTVAITAALASTSAFAQDKGKTDTKAPKDTTTQTEYDQFKTSVISSVRHCTDQK